MTYFVLQRLRHGLLSLLGIVTLVFVLARLTGSPARLYLPEDAPDSMVETFNTQNGLDGSTFSQLVDYLGGVARLDFGDSLLYNQSALSVVLERYPATLQLAGATMLIAFVLSIVVGSASASRRGGKSDSTFRIGSLTALSVPDFWVGIMAITVFAVYLGWLPTSGSGGLQYWILPLLTLSLRPIGILTQVVRTSMITALESDYIRVAKAKGVSRRVLIYKHALRNAAIPIITVAGVLTAQVVNGALIVETVFGWPGIGNLMVSAIKGRDFAVIQAVVMVTGGAIIIMNFLIDLTYSWINPQIRLGE
jgi:peptide/nickel transport system permease protein